LSGAASYNVYRNGTKVNSTAISGTSYTDSGLTSGTSYTYTVQGVTSGGAGGAQSAPVTGTTTGTPPALPAPTGLTVTGTTSSSVSLSWSAETGAASYNVYRNGSKVNASAVTTNSYTDSGLAASTAYNYAVTAVNSSGESAQSATVTGTTNSSWTCSTTTTSNYYHVQAGRAHDSGGYALANGSNQNMGLDNVFYTATLAQTAPGYYVIGNCP
jgi:poly(3-hydroxybutyrate) depolymerase